MNPTHLGDGIRHAKETGQNAGVDGVTDHGIGTGGYQLVACLMMTERLQFLPRCSPPRQTKRRPAACLPSARDGDYAAAQR